MYNEENISDFLNTPLNIGTKQVKSRLFLSPMASLGNVAYRELIESYGGYGLLFSEMCNAVTLPYENRYTSHSFKWRDEEKDNLVFQLFGSSPEQMALAAQRIEHENFFGVDINFGCSVSTICKKNCGAELLKTPELAQKIVYEIRKAVKIPVFVKFRTGWKDDPEGAIELSKRFEDSGADALSFHPRVAPDRRLRPPKWEYIGLIKNAVSIPVFGNGNVFTKEDCSKIIGLTGCDGILLGRIAIARPWIFSHITMNRFEKSSDYKNAIMQYTFLLEKHYDDKTAVRLFKKTTAFYAANFKFGLKLRPQLCKGNTLDEMRDNIELVFSTPKEVSSRPNMNLFL